MAGVDQGLVSLVAVVMIASVGAPADNQLHDLPPALRLPCADLTRGGGWPSGAEASDSRRREAPRGALSCRREPTPPLVRRSGRPPYAAPSPGPRPICVDHQIPGPPRIARVPSERPALIRSRLNRAPCSRLTSGDAPKGHFDRH